MGKKKIGPFGKKLSNGSKVSPLESETPSISSEPTIPVSVSEVSVVGQEPLRAKKEDYKFAVPNIEQISKTEEEKKRQEYLKTIDTGQSQFTSLMSEFNRGLLSVGSAVPESIAIMAKKLEDSMGGEKPLEDYQTYKWAKAADKWIKDTYPTNPIYQDELGTKLASGAGQAVSFLLGGEASAGLKLSRGASMAYMGAAQNGVPEYENAKQMAEDANSLPQDNFIQKYATDAEDIQRRSTQYEQLKGQDPERVAWDAFKYNAIIGTTEAIPFDIALSKFDKITNGSIRKAFISALEQGSTEAFQEVTSQYLSNLSAKEIYDKQREITEGLKDAAVPAFILGGILGGAGNTIAAKINDPNITPEEKSTLLVAQKEVESQLSELPTDEDEIVYKPIENNKTKELTAKRDALEQQLTSNKELSDETKKILVEQSNDLDTQIENEKEAAIKNNTNNSYLDSNISSLESQKNTLEEDMAKVPENSKWAIQAQIDNLNAKINDFKQQKNVEASEAIPAQTEAVRMLEETGSELNTNKIKQEVQDAIQISSPEKILQREPGKTGTTGSERGGVEPIKQGEEITGTRQEIGKQDTRYKSEVQKEETKNQYIETKIKEHIDEGDFESGSEYENVARNLYAQKFDKAKDLDEAMKYNFKAEEGDIDAAFTATEQKKNGDYVYKTKASEYTVKKEGDQLSIMDKNGKEPSYKTRIKIIKDYEKNFDYSKGRSALVDVKNISPEDADRLIAEKSENPAEIIEAHERILSEQPFVKGDYKDQVISENINKVKGSSYNRFGDKSNITNNKARAYFNENKGVGIDVLAQELSETAGVEITPQDVVDFIDRFPNGIDDYTKSIKNPLIADLKNKFREVTGLSLNERVVDAFDKFSEKETKLLSESYDNYEQIRKEFFDAIERGEITEPPEREEPTRTSSDEDKKSVAPESQKRVDRAEESERKPEYEQGVTPPSPPSKKSEPKEPGGKKKKSFLNRVLESSTIKGDKKLQEAIEAKGLDYDVFTHEEAKKIAQGIIESEGVDKALAMARDRNSDISGNIRTFIYGKALDQLTEFQQEFKKHNNEAEAEAVTREWANLAEELDEYLRDAGRAIASVGDYYKSNAIGIQMRETNRLKKQSKSELEKGNKIKKIKQVEKEFEKIDKEFTKKIKNKKQPTGKKNIFNRTSEERTKRIEELKERWKNASKSSLSASAVGLNSEQIEVAVELGAEYLASGIHNFAKWSKKMMGELGINEDQAKHVWDNTKLPKNIDNKERTLAQISEEEFIEERNEEATKKKLAILNKMFPKKIIESAKKRTDLHEKIVNAYDAGLFEGGVNKEGMMFEELFYEKFGIVNQNKPVIQENIKKFAEKIHKAPEGSLLQKELYSDLLTYIENEKGLSLRDTGMSVWYANILSSYETHLRNSQFNINTALVAEPFLLAEKRILKGDVLGAIKIFKNLFSDMGDASRQAKAVWRGGVSKYEKPQAKSVLDKFMFGKGVFGSLLSPAKYPGRALRASDVFFTSMLANAKQYEALKRTVEKSNPGLNKAQQEVLVNEYLGNTTERVASAEEQAKKDVEKVFEVDPLDPKNKQANEAYKLRVAEIVEQSRPKEIYEEGVDWARRALLTNEPEGMWKGVAQSLKTLGEAILPAKLVIPFVNVPINLAARFIDRGPIGYINAIRGYRGSGRFRQELTQDQRTELFLKATNYTVGIIALYQIMNAINDKDDDDKNPFVITGKQTGDYLDNKGITRGGGMDEYSIYMYGNKVMSYKYTPWAPLFAPLGYVRDHIKYGESKGLSSNMAYAAMNYIGFVNDQAAMKGLGNFLGMMDERSLKNITAEKLAERLTSTAQNFIIPMSGLVKATNNDIRGILGEVDKVNTTWWDPILKDVPFVEEMMENRTDHLGRDIKEVFDMPLLPEKFAIKETNDKYYKLFNEKGYFPNFYTNKTIFINNEEKEMSKEELYKLNKYRGKYALEILNKEDVLPEDEEGERTTFQYLETLDNEDFKKEMNKVFEMATKRAKIKLFGAKLANKKYDLMSESDIDKYEKFIEKLDQE